MELLNIILICVVALLVLVFIRLLLRPQEVEFPQIEEMEEKLRFALAS